MAEKTTSMIRKMSNKDLVYVINKMRHERENPKIYGKHGTSKWVTENQFWYGYHKDLIAELHRRKSLGIISKSAGLPKK